MKACDFDFVGGTDLPGELNSTGWEDVVLTECERCGYGTNWPEQRDGRTVCPVCADVLIRTTTGAYAVQPASTAA